MAKLYFRYGTVSSAKTLNLLAVAHNYRQQGKRVILIKPALDDRFGKEKIKSRAGLHMPADIMLSPGDDLKFKDFEDIHCVVVDEAQFVTAKQIEQLRELTRLMNIPVICYGLRVDFRTNLFEASKRLMELSDSIEEVKTTCHYCNKKAVANLKHVNGVATVTGPSVQLGAEELFFPTCYDCYKNEVAKGKLKEAVGAGEIC
jgi:thymidine kinase